MEAAPFACAVCGAGGPCPMVRWSRGAEPRHSSRGTSACHVWWGRIWAKTDLAEFCSKRNQARKNKRVPLMRFHIGFVVSKIPQHNELSQLPQSPSMSVGGARTRLGMGLNRAVLLEASLWPFTPVAFLQVSTARACIARAARSRAAAPVRTEGKGVRPTGVLGAEPDWGAGCRDGTGGRRAGPENAEM